jgi:hypothetical protein
MTDVGQNMVLKHQNLVVLTVIIYIVIEICWFCKSAANFKKWLTYNGGELHKLYCACTHIM